MTALLAFKAAKLLREARNYITDRTHWVKGAFTADANSDPLIYEGWGGGMTDAPRVCSLGAIGRAANLYDWKLTPEIEAAVHTLEDVMGEGVAEFNDFGGTSHEDVLAAFDLAIEEACKVVRKEAEEKSNDQ